jgi:hypothetical protein
VTLPLADGERIDNRQVSLLLAPIFSPLLSLTTQLPSDSFCGNASCLIPMTSVFFIVLISYLTEVPDTERAIEI